MAYTPKLLAAPSYPSTSGTTLYTVPAATSAIVKNIFLTNTSSNDATVDLSMVPSAGSASSSNRVLSGYTVPANGVAAVDCSIVMPTGSFLYALSGSSNTVVVTISGVEIT